jgi:hypothetical protein
MPAQPPHRPVAHALGDLGERFARARGDPREVLGQDERHPARGRHGESIHTEPHGLLDEERVPLAQAVHVRGVSMEADGREPARRGAGVEAPQGDADPVPRDLPVVVVAARLRRYEPGMTRAPSHPSRSSLRAVAALLLPAALFAACHKSGSSGPSSASSTGENFEGPCQGDSDCELTCIPNESDPCLDRLGTCFADTLGDLCSTDDECGGPGAAVCETCSGTKMCVQACGPDPYYDCGPGATCDAATGHCTPHACQADADCPKHFGCKAGGCARKACSADAQCPGGHCVLGACFADLGICDTCN